MCGIAGILNADRRAVSPDVLDRMVDALAHRGPDDRGCHVAGPVGIGMRRLSIIDVQGGHQPMASDDGKLLVVYNGECYNHADLRRELEAIGFTFRTHCDTEVVLYGYRAWGIEELCRRLNGIYAFCVWDAGRRKAYLVRDRLGVKPLYHVGENGRFAFSSEVRSLALSGLVRARIDETALWGYLAYQFTPTDHTLIAGIRKLPAGHFLEWDDGRIDIRRYWDFPNQGEDRKADRRERTEALESLLWDTVKRQMMSDVPIGCFLSGGLDSTIIACMMARLSNHPLRTFSISFPASPDCDESEYFERQAAELKAEHETIRFSEREVIESLDDFAWSMDHPVADPAMLPTYLLSRAAARQVKVVLTGEGADEVFAGYPYYRPFLSGGSGGNGCNEDNRLADWVSFSKALSDRVGMFLPGPRNDLSSPISNFPYALDPRFIWNLLHRDRRPDFEVIEGLTKEIEEEAVGRLTNVSPLQRALALDTKVWLANNLMPKLDKMTMAHSLEGRVPFLDHRIVEFAFTLPGSFKIGSTHGKMILREAVKGIIPERMVHRPKHGFNVPLYSWFRGSLADFARSAILGPTLKDAGLFERKALEALLAAHIDMNVNVARPMWELICLSRWLDRLKRELATDVGRADRASAPATVDTGIRSATPSSTDVPDVLDAPLPEDTVRGRCDIVVPVYEGIHYVRDLLRSIALNTTYPYRVILADDSGNDVTFRELENLVSGDDRVELYRNAQNVGFVKTCNRGMALARGEYVCIQNTDTIVTPGWLSRMVRCAESDRRIAIVNPLSNSCVNLSVPMPPGANVVTMARLIGRRSRRRYPDITTAVGFCMLVKRRYLQRLGEFDEAYGRGYCEESDMCMRYTEAGLRVVAADDAFVYHKGCASFGTWMDRYLANRKIFDRRWKHAYLRDYRQFLDRNPLQYMRDALLRGTIHKTDWTPAVALAVERYARGIRRRNANGVAPKRLRRLGSDPGVAPASGSADIVRHATRCPRTGPDATQREVRYATRSYVQRLGEARTDALRITYLIGDQMPVCGGIISVVQLAREMLLMGHDVKIVTRCEELDPERFNLPAQPLVFPNTAELVRLFPPSDVVVATYWTTAHDFLPALRARHDFVSVHFVQDYEVYFYPEDDWENRRKAAACYVLSEHRIVKSQWLKGLIERNHGVPCTQIHLGLDLGVFRNRKTSDELGQPPRVISVARPGEARRGFREVLDVFRRIKAVRPDVEFVFFGTPREHMPTDVPFPYFNAGRIENLDKVAALIGSCDVLVDSSLFQGFGRPGIEAMACGTACVLTSEGGINEYARDGRNCLMCKPRDTAAMAAAVVKLLEDDGLRTSLRRAGLEMARRYCHVDEARRHIEHYRGWLRSRVPSESCAIGV